MKPAIKAMIATAASVLLFGAAGCASDTSNGDGEQAPDNALSKIDPCSVLKTEKAEKIGLPAHGKPANNFDSQPGCKYIGSHAGIGVYRVAGESLDEYESRPVWAEFKRLQVNGREGAQARATAWTDTDCLTAVAAGGGVVAVQASASDPRKPFDGCAESLKVAKLIEPDLPE